MYLFCDFETTGIDPMGCEALTAYFILTGDDLVTIDQNEFTFRPYGHGGEHIHGITWEQSQTFDDPKESFDRLVDWIPEQSNLVCHANYNNGGMGKYYYDKAVLEMLFVHHGDRFDFFKKIARSYSTHTLYKSLFPRTQILHKLSRYDLVSICEATGVKKGKHHDAKDDTIMVYEIFKKLRRIQDELRVGPNGWNDGEWYNGRCTRAVLGSVEYEVFGGQEQV